jgi:cytochrome c553
MRKGVKNLNEGDIKCLSAYIQSMVVAPSPRKKKAAAKSGSLQPIIYHQVDRCD